MDLGQFSLSLAVKDLDKSMAFYEKFGFKVIDGGHTNAGYPDTDTTRWRILKTDSVVIGLFEGMFEHNIMTFNPKDVRSIQRVLKEGGVKLTQEAAEAAAGPAFITLEDPDGN